MVRPTASQDCSRLRLIVADDDPLARRALRDGMQERGVVVVAEARDGQEAVELAAHYVPDVVLVDVGLPGGDGLTATRRILQRRPELHVVLLATADDPDLALLGLRMGACGYVVKDIEMAALARALRAARAGEIVVSRGTTAALVERLRTIRENALGLRPVASTLTRREWEVLDLLCAGMTVQDAAETLTLSVETVRSHVKNLRRKLGARSRGEAVSLADGLRAELLRRPPTAPTASVVGGGPHPVR